MTNFLERHYWKLITCCAVTAFLVFGGFAWIRQLVGQQKMVQAVRAAQFLPSFELRRTERLNSAHHQDHPTIVTVLARRTDGGEVSLQEIPAGADPSRPSIGRHIVLPTEGMRIEVDDHTKTKSTFRYDTNDPRFLGARLMKFDIKSNCGRWLNGQQFAATAGQEVVAGVVVYKFVINGLNHVNTTWMAPSIGCVVVMSRYDWGVAGTPGSSTALSTPDYLRLGEPAEALFAVPEDYREMKPSERHKEEVAFLRLAESAQQRLANDNYYRQADAAYARNK